MARGLAVRLCDAWFCKAHGALTQLEPDSNRSDSSETSADGDQHWSLLWMA